ncbi:MAG: EamA family transporter, partial [bacterium]
MTEASPHVSSRDERTRGRWLVFIATVSWGTSATLARSMFRDDGVSPVVAVELRLLTAVALLLAWMGFRQRNALRVDRADLGYLVVLGTLGVAAVQVTYYHAIATLGVGPAI